MTALLSLQHAFQQYLMSADNLEGVLPEIVADHLPKEKRLKIYFDAYRIRLMEILKLDFSKTYVLLGEDLYFQAFTAYLNAHPSSHFNVRYFGQQFPQFLRDCSPFCDEPIFAEMADFEWTLMSTLDAEDAHVLSLNDLQQVPQEDWPKLMFKFHPSVKHVAYEWDTPPLWKSIDNEEPPRAAKKLSQPQHWLIWRKGISSRYESISNEQVTLFNLLSESGYCFSEILESLNQTMPEEKVPEFAISHLQHWIEEELISGIEVK